MYFLVKPRFPVSQALTTPRRDVSFLKNPLFWIFSASNIFQCLGYFIPGIYLPSYASDLGLTPVQSTAVLSFFNLASVAGQIGLGTLVDRRGILVPLSFSTGVAALSVGALGSQQESFTSCSFRYLIWVYGERLQCTLGEILSGDCERRPAHTANGVEPVCLRTVIQNFV